jgi:hypothetical protein
MSTLARMSHYGGADIPDGGADIPVCPQGIGNQGRQECLPHRTLRCRWFSCGEKCWPAVVRQAFWIGLAVLLLLPGLSTAGNAQQVVLGSPADRPDRLVTITGPHQTDLVAEYSVDRGSTWHPATIYPGTTGDHWLTSNPDVWNRAAIEGRMPADQRPCLWNHFFDLPLPLDLATLRLRKREASGGPVVLQQTVDLKPARDVVMIDRRNVAALCGGTLPDGWNLATPGKKPSVGPSIHCAITDAIQKQPTCLTLQPKLKGWYRIYLGTETYGTCSVWLSKTNARYEFPKHSNDDPWGLEPRMLREYYLCSADMTGQDLCISPGGARKWFDVWVHHVRFVPMTPQEIAQFQQARELAKTKGRPFAGYVEPVTPGSFPQPESFTLREHLRNEMKLNEIRGSTDAYVHVIRIGSKAWYHSDLVERFMEWGPTWPRWMREGDPMAVAVEEGHKVGLRVFADVGMNSPYYNWGKDYSMLTERFARDHPEYVLPSYTLCFDYRKPPVQNYVTSILRELLTKYDLDGVNLDFGRWGYQAAYDVPSLVAVLKQIDRDRQAAAKRLGHPVLISARIDYELPPAKAAANPVFLRALTAWAHAGQIDRIMVNTDNFDFVPIAAVRWAPYLDAIKGTQTKLWGDLYLGTLCKGGSPAKDFEIARSWAQQGLDGGFFYYTPPRPTMWEQINWRLRLVDFPNVKVDPDY